MYEHLQPRHTKIEKVIGVRNGNVILEDHNRFPLGKSNLYLLSENGELIWEAERPAPDAHYIRVKLNDDGESLSAYTTSRHACELSLKTGKLLSKLEFK